MLDKLGVPSSSTTTTSHARSVSILTQCTPFASAPLYAPTGISSAGSESGMSTSSMLENCSLPTAYFARKEPSRASQLEPSRCQSALLEAHKLLAVLAKIRDYQSRIVSVRPFILLTDSLLPRHVLIPPSNMDDEHLALRYLLLGRLLDSI